MSRTIRIKYPSGEYHTALVNKFVNVHTLDDDILTIWFNDLTLTNSLEQVGSFALLKKSIDGVYTHLYCNNDYERIYEDISKYIMNKKYEDLSLDLLPSSIDIAENYSYFAKDIVVDDDIKEIKIEIDNQLIKYILEKKEANEKMNSLLEKLVSIKNNTDTLVFTFILATLKKEINTRKLPLVDGYIELNSYKVLIDNLKDLSINIYKESIKEDDSDIYDSDIIVPSDDETEDIPIEEVDESSNNNELFTNVIDGMEKTLEDNDNSISEIFNEMVMVDEKKEEIIKIDFNDEYVVYKYISALDLGEYTSLTYENITSSYTRDMKNVTIVKCLDEDMFKELKLNKKIYIPENTSKKHVLSLQDALDNKLFLITKYKIFKPL